MSMLLVPFASADIVGIQSVQTCQHDGLPSGTLTNGGVYCTANGGDFSLTAILNGTIQLIVNNSQTPSYNIVNDTGAPPHEPDSPLRGHAGEQRLHRHAEPQSIPKLELYV
jgi:hypothetical protein